MPNSTAAAEAITSDYNKKKDLRISWTGLSLVFMTPALGGFMYGYDIGATSFVLALLRRQNADKDDISTLDDDHGLATPGLPVWWDSFGPDDANGSENGNDADDGWREGMFVSAISLGALLGSHLVLFRLAAVMGRRMELRVAAVFYLIGALCNVSSGTILARSNWGWPLLLFGRTCFGAGIGFVMHGAPNYMAEMSPTRIRGAVVSAKESLIVLGILAGYAVGEYVYTSTSSRSESSQGETSDWTLLYQVSLILSLPMLCLTFLVPRSTRWLLLKHNQQQEGELEKPTGQERRREKGYRQEAKESLQFLYRDDVTVDFDRMVQQIMASQWRNVHSTPVANADGLFGVLGSLFTDSSITSSLVVALGLLCFQEGSGQPAVLSYATIIFEEAGWGGYASVITAVLMLCVSLITVLLVDIVGRKRLLQLCAAIMGLALFVLSVGASSIMDTEAPEWQRKLLLVSLFVYISGYQLGFGPITWLIIAEVFPSHVRGQASALAVEFKYILNFIVQFGVPIFQRRFGWRCTFGFFGVLMALAATYFIPYFVQETAGLSLEQIEAQPRTTQDHNDDGHPFTEMDRTTTVLSGSSYDSDDDSNDDEKFDESTCASLMSDQSPASEESHLLADFSCPPKRNSFYSSA